MQRTYSAVVLKRGHGCQEISRGALTLDALQHGKFLNRNVSLPNVTQVLIFHPKYYLVPTDMEVDVKFLGILQAEFVPTCKHSGAKLGELISRHAKSL